jgi:hypothetical protein
MSPLAVVHVAASMVMLFVAVPAAYRAGSPIGRIAAITAGLAALVASATGALAHGAWSRGYRAAIELASQSAAGWLDAKLVLGACACVAALIGCVVEMRAGAASKLASRVCWTACAVFSIAALAMIAAVHARVPSALL